MRMTSSRKLVELAALGWRYRHWYEEGRQEIVRLCACAGWDADHFIDVLSLLSPRKAVRRNVRLACMYMRGVTLPADVTNNVRLSLAHYEQTGEIRGPKTKEFARALKGDLHAVPLDTWMALACGTPNKWTAGARRKATRRIWRVANTMGILPAQAQAAIWAGTLQQERKKAALTALTEELVSHLEEMT